MSLASDTLARQKATLSRARESASKPRFLDPMIAGAIFLACLAYLCLFLRYSAIELDEGIVLQGAERILHHGQIPYRDFFTFYTPGSFYLVAVVFRILGDSFVAARFSIAVCGAVCSVLTYVLARRVCSVGIAVFCAVLATITGAAFRFLVLHNPYSTLFVFLAVYAAIRSIETYRTVWMFAAGSFASFALLIEQSKGAGVIAGLVLGFGLIRLFGGTLGGKHGIAGFALGVGWPLAGTCAYFAHRHALSIMFQDWLWPLHHYTKANHVVYGFQNWSESTQNMIFRSGPLWLRAVKVVTVSPTIVVPVLPLVAIGMLCYLSWNAWSTQSRSPNFSYYVMICAVSFGLLVSIVMVRPDSLHFMYLAPVWYVILAWTLGADGARSKLLRHTRPYLFGYVALAFGMLAMASLLPATGARHEIATRRGVIKTNGEDTVIPFVQAHTAEGDRVLVYPYLPLYNYLTGTLSPARYDFFQPGMNTPEQAREIVASLQNGPPVLLQPAFSDTIPQSWAETPLSAIVNDPITDYLARNYRVCRVLKSPENLGFWWMVPKSRGCS